MSQSFKDVLGVREGAVESHHAFNMYASDLKAHIESSHPRLRQLVGVIVAIILYAGDTAIPADSLEDLQLAVALFEQFCNDDRLFIATPKTFLTVSTTPQTDM